jgi:hypothetical protein
MPTYNVISIYIRLHMDKLIALPMTQRHQSILVVLHLENLSSVELIKMGVDFQINGFVIAPLLSAFLIIVLGTLFLILCVKRFSAADFSRIKVFKRGHR